MEIDLKTHSSINTYLNTKQRKRSSQSVNGLSLMEFLKRNIQVFENPWKMFGSFVLFFFLFNFIINLNFFDIKVKEFTNIQLTIPFLYYSPNVAQTLSSRFASMHRRNECETIESRRLKIA